MILICEVVFGNVYILASLCSSTYCSIGFFVLILGTCPTPRIGNFLHCYIQSWEKLTPYNIMKQKKSNIWFTNKHILKFGMQKYYLLWHSAVKLSKNGDFFSSFLKLGIFSLKVGEKKPYFLPLGTRPNYGHQNGLKKSCRINPYNNSFSCTIFIAYIYIDTNFLITFNPLFSDGFSHKY